MNDFLDAIKAHYKSGNNKIIKVTQDTTISDLIGLLKYSQKTEPKTQEDLVPLIEPEEPTSSDKDTQSIENSEKIDVLIAEDNEINQIYIQYLIEDTGLSYKFVENGILAVEAWKTSHPDMILMDISMPEMDGIQATKAIRTIEKKDKRKHVPIIATTAHAMQGDKEKFLESGMDDYISKPISKTQFMEKINQWHGTVKTKTKAA